jgi:hypothetical protein
LRFNHANVTASRPDGTWAAYVGTIAVRDAAADNAGLVS